MPDFDGEGFEAVILSVLIFAALAGLWFVFEVRP